MVKRKADKESSLIKTSAIKETGKTIKKSKDFKLIHLESIKENSWKEGKKEMDSFNGQMESFMWESGRKEKDKGTGYGSIRKVIAIMEIGKMVREMVMECSLLIVIRF